MSFHKPNRSFIFALISLQLSLSACNEKKEKLFTNVSDESGITFSNDIQETDDLNILNFEYMYNGGGVAIGDINNDGLADIYFTGNQVPNKLYLNKGGLKFEDVTESAGVAGKLSWATGVTMADVNADGLLDLYVCYSGKGDVDSRSNQLFINKTTDKTNPLFEDEAKQYNLDAPGSNSTQAVFFDLDRDGDLDMFLLNHSTMFFSPLVNKDKLRIKRHPYFSNRMYLNTNGHFTDISEKAGLTGGGNNFGLGVSAGDFNNDGWQDLYITNDFVEQDFLLLNNHSGGFSDVTRKAVKHTSKYGMGCDAADYNNDGLLDIAVLDMLPEDNKRQKLLRGPDEYDKYNVLIDSGYFHQYMRNTLQLNAGLDSNGIPVFSEIGQLAGISNTDWSWAPLFADFDNDGNKDLFISNGYFRDFTNLDFLTYTVQEYRNKYKNANKTLVHNLVREIPQTRLKNYLFRNKGDLTFENNTADWGLTDSAVSNGSAYADLDNDGDLDLVINHIGKKASVLRNNADHLLNNNYLQIKLADTGLNPHALGAKVTVETGSGKRKLVEMQPTRGFQSSIDQRLHIGLGEDTIINTIIIQWPDGSGSTYGPYPANRMVELKKTNATYAKNTSTAKKTLFEDITASSNLRFNARENRFVDFNAEFLLPYQLSRQGPRLAKADVNHDGLQDIFIGAPQGQSASLFLQTNDEKFREALSQPWKNDSLYEDIQSAFFDADGDGDADLYVVSGGTEPYSSPDKALDRLYLNDGKGNFTKSTIELPHGLSSRSCVAIADYNKDNKPDIFVGGRMIQGKYGQKPESFLLKNETTKGNIKFTNSIAIDAKDLQFCGMITDATWTDINNDGWLDLIVVGDWMPITVFMNNKGVLMDKTDFAGLGRTGGLWTRIIPFDIDGDKDDDFILGNLGANLQLKATSTEPMTLYVNDFFKTGVSVPLLCYYIQGVSYPYANRDEIAEPMPILKKKYLRYADYATATINDIFTDQQRLGMQESFVHILKNCWLENLGNGKFALRELPVMAQFSPIQGAVMNDFNNDGKNEIFAAGNFYPFRPQLGREDAGKGILLQANREMNIIGGYGSTGIIVDGDVRDMLELKTRSGKKIIVITKNDDALQVIRAK